MKTKLAFKSREGKEEIMKLYDLALEQWYTPNEKLSIRTRYGETFVIAAGDPSAPPILLLHGTAMNSVMWLSDVYEYVKSYRVYAIDVPGEPGKSDERQQSLKGTEYAQWLSDVYQGLSLKKAYLAGISLGGWLCLKFAVAYPEKVSGLVLINPGGIGPQKKLFLILALIQLMKSKKASKKVSTKVNTKVNGNQDIPDVVLRYQNQINKNFNFRTGALPIFSDHDLGRLTMPVHLYVGGKDIIFHSEKTVKRLRKNVPHARIHSKPEAGHVLIQLTGEIMEELERN